MTTRQSVAASQRNSTFKVQPTVVSGRKALVVKLDWTTAPVVKTTIRRDFKLSILAMDTQKWTPIQRGMMLLKAGQTVHFTQSDDHPGYYYVTIVGESCTCTAGLYKQQCHHQREAASFEACRRMEEDIRQHNELAAPVEYRVYEDEYGQFIPQFRNAHGWFSFVRPGWLALGYAFRSQEEASAFLDEQRGLEAVA